MPINQYVPATIYTLLGVATTSILRIASPCDGWITEFYAKCGTGPVTTDALFDINIAGTSIFTSDPTQRPKIVAGGTTVTKVINQAVSKNDILTIDLDALGSAPIGNPIDLRLTIKEGSPRKSISYTTGSLADGASEDFTLALGFGFVIERITTTFKAWVRGYNTPAYRTSDASRAITQPPTGEHGVIFDVYLNDAANLTIDIMNGRFGTDLQGTRDGNIAFTLQNKSGGTQTIQVTLDYLELEL